MAHLQLEAEALKFVQSAPPTLPVRTLPVPSIRSKPVAFTSTVPKFSGVTSWDQYRQVFDAIFRSNGWDDAKVAIQLCPIWRGRIGCGSVSAGSKKGPRGPDWSRH